MGSIVILGAGECGTRTAINLRRAGYDRDLVLVGAEDQVPYERPPLSKHLFDQDFEPKQIVPADQLAEAKIDWRSGIQANGIELAEKRVNLSDGSVLRFDALLLATGAQPRRLAGNPPGIHYLRSWNDAQSIRAHVDAGSKVILIGGGYISLELAASLRKVGAAVTVLEAAERILSRALLPEIGESLLDRHRQEGVVVRTDVRIASVGASSVVLADGERLEGDLIVAGIGAEPQISLAARSGLKVDDGIAVDEFLRTSDPNVYAAGDCCAFPHGPENRRLRLECWRNAVDQAELACGSMLGEKKAYACVPYFWTDQYDLTVQAVGIANRSRPALRRDFDDGGYMLFQIDAKSRLTHACALGIGTRRARDVGLAQILLERLVALDPRDIVDPQSALRSLL